MYIQKIATILMDDEIHDILNFGNEYGFQEYIFMSDCDDVKAELSKLELLLETYVAREVDNLYLISTIREIKEALILLEKDEIQNVVFVYQN